LVQGTYTFQLTVTDNNGATASDAVTVTVNAAVGNLTVFTYGAIWKYLDNGSNQGTLWRTVGFNDGSWASGPGQLGYGDGDEATVVSFGPNSSAKYITTYFRKVVNISSPGDFSYFRMGVRRDDGIVVYVNGMEVWRNTLPTGTIAYNTLATSAVSDDGNTIQTANIASTAFVHGANTIAVEIHQNAATSSDISFDMELVGIVPGAPLLTRGPYLQMGNSQAATLRWRTDVPTDSRIEVGTAFGTYSLSAINPTVTTEHEVRITGLLPDTKYFYRFGSSSYVLQSGTDNHFRTAPPPNSTRKIAVAVFGDCGRNDKGYQSLTLNSYLNYVGTNPAELLLLLGDNAYTNGTDAEYTTGFFNAYSGNILKNHMMFPAPGNHDYYATAGGQASKNVPYYDIFTMPAAAESGGVPSGTEAYYSFDWGPIHFLSLDSYGTETANNLRLYDTAGPQVTWIKQDLEANNKKWTIAYWHHPPYTMGSHNSDTEAELVRIRERFIRILERYGVDMIMCGHSHDYERSYLLKGYYGNEASFNLATHAVNSSSGKYDGSLNSCPYTTPSGQVDHGTVYVVSGSAGASGGVQAGYPHNALPFAQNDGGMFYFEVEDNRLNAKWIRKDGVIADQFSILKDVSTTEQVTISSGQSTTLTASWIGNYQWSNGATTRSITVNPAATATYSVTDGSTACLTDHFTVNVVPQGVPITLQSRSLPSGKQQIRVFPVPVVRGEKLTMVSGHPKPVEITILDGTGRIMERLRINGSLQINTSAFKPGLYFIQTNGPEGRQVAKFMVSSQ
ncbi:MAG TPA: metallophosphoesterase, partial [Phnomibacter sp.]|nr:metallophosphoesterase [Phnomibacter sp.]